MMSDQHIEQATIMINRASEATGERAVILSNLAVAYSNLAVAEATREKENNENAFRRGLAGLPR